MATSKPLAKMSFEELDELRKKQETLLNNKALLTKLPDRGQKLRSTLEVIQKLLAFKKHNGPMPATVSKLNDVLAAMEWRVQPVMKKGEEEEESEPEDDDEAVCDGPEAAEKTLKILAAVGRPLADKKKTRILPAPVSASSIHFNTVWTLNFDTSEFQPQKSVAFDKTANFRFENHSFVAAPRKPRSTSHFHGS